MSQEKRQRQKAGRQARLEAEAKARKRRQNLRRGVIVLVILAAVVGISVAVGHSSSNSSKKSSTSTTTANAAQAAADKASAAAGCPSNPHAKLNKPTWKSPPPMTIDTSKNYTATIKTDVGTITAKLDAKSNPVAVNDFVFLAKQKYYNCVIFHRVIPGFMDQTGDPTGTGTGSVGYTVQGSVPAKANPQYPVGSLAMAKTGSAPAGTSSNQFFIMAGEKDPLPPDYSLFGTVTSGLDVVKKINADGNANPQANGVPPKVIHRMLSVTINES